MTNQSVKILVVDDEPPIRKLLDVGLSSQGFAVQGAPNAKTAIQMAQADAPDLVILDLGLPDISGHDLLANGGQKARLSRSSSCRAAPTRRGSSRRSKSVPMIM